MKATSTESVGSCASFLQPRRRLSFEDDPDQNLEMTNPFASPPQQQGQFRNSFASDSLPLSRGAVSLSIPSDRPVIPTTIVQNTPGVQKPGSPSFSPWQNENFNFNINRNTCEPTQVPSTQNTPEPVKTSYCSEEYNGNKCVTPGAGDSGPSDRHALVKLMMDGDELPEIKCPCGSGPCIVLTSHTARNPNRRFYKCPATIKCKFFKWCDELDQSSKNPSKPTQETRSPGKISKPQNTPLGSQNNLLIADVTTPEPKQTFCMPQWVDNPARSLETLNNSNGNQNKLSIADVTTREPKQTISMPLWVDNAVKPLETVNNSNGNQNKLSIADATTPERKQRRTLSPYESVKDLFGEDDMKSIEYWCKDQNDPNSTAAIEHERSKELSPGKRPHPPNTIGEISPMKRLNLSESIPVVANCPMCGATGQCIECPILTCFKDDEFAEKKPENAINGGGISNLANISPIGGMVAQNATPSSSKRTGKCFNCGKEGHWWSECTSPLGANSSCFKCGKLGHWMRNCKP